MTLRGRLKANGWPDRIIVAAVILLFLSIIAFVFYKRAVVPFRADYEGTVVDKTLNIKEEQTGSKVQLFLLIRSNDGKQFNVSVDRELYDRAKVGMHIKHSLEGTVFTDEK